jgi:uncharacterized metal-binding protein
MSQKTGCDCSCTCNSAPTFIYPCSGAADVGELADRAARLLAQADVGSMSCLAGIGGNISGFVQSAKSAGKNLVIDGCPLDCAKKTMERAGVTSILHIRVTDCGFKKGHSPVTDDSLRTLTDKCKELVCR